MKADIDDEYHDMMGEPDIVIPRATPTGEWTRYTTVYVLCSCIAGVTAVLTLNRLFGGNAVVATAVLAFTALCVVLCARRVFAEDRRRIWAATITVAAILMLLVAGLASWPAIAAMGAAYPMIYAAYSYRLAIALSVVTSAVPVVTAMLRFGWATSETLYGASISLVAVVTGPTIGAITTRNYQTRVQLASAVAELAASRIEVGHLSRQSGITAERERLALEIHDTLTQGFASIVALAQAIETELEQEPDTARRHLKLVIGTARESLNEARAMVDEMSPQSTVGNLPLTQAVKRLADRLRQESDIDVEILIEPDLPALRTSTEVVLLRVTQEAIANIRKHSRASRVRIELKHTNSTVCLKVADNGVGLPTQPRDGHGLRGVRTRVGQIGGTVSIVTAVGHGVAISIEVPV